MFTLISLNGKLFKLAENNELARLHPDVCRNTDATRNGPACTRAQRPGNVHIYGTCAFQRRRINSTVSHRHPNEIRTLHRLSDLFCQRKRFRVPARNKRSPSRLSSLSRPPLPLSSSPFLSFSLILPPDPWLGPRNYNFGRIYDDNTIERILVLELFTPFGAALRAPCRSNYFVFCRAPPEPRRGRTERRGQKSGGEVEDPRGRFLELF